MKLERQHREALLNELQKARAEKESQEFRLNRREDDEFVKWVEIDIFLADQRIKLIEKSLIDNEIDF
jgi:hypothetical protein